jgi:hypothetical protein
MLAAFHGTGGWPALDGSYELVVELRKELVPTHGRGVVTCDRDQSLGRVESRRLAGTG